MYTNKQIWSVSYPILLSLLAQNVINVTDTAFLGHVSKWLWELRPWVDYSISVYLLSLSDSVQAHRSSLHGAMEKGVTVM